jgi:hypothetical protein
MTTRQHEKVRSQPASPSKSSAYTARFKAKAGLGQGGGMREGGFTPEPLSHADTLMLQNTIGNNAVARLVAPHFTQRAFTVQRYEIEGPLNIHDPVHETITQEALRRAGLLRPGENYRSRRVWEYMRGVIWNDDPEGQFFDDNTTRTDDFASGIPWGLKFKVAERNAEKGRSYGPKDDLLPRSHFGDLQFLHGMGSRDGEAAAVTQGHVMLWAEFTYKVAIGDIAGTTKVDSVPVAGIPELFPKLGGQTVRQLFAINQIGNVRQRAAGSLLHTIQDSYASGHVQREKLDGGRKGNIVAFQSYTHQDHGKHGHDDAFHGSGSDVQKLRSVPGALDAVDKSAQVLKFIAEKRPWEDVELYLKMEVFGLVPHPLESGPGDQYRKSSAPQESGYSPSSNFPSDVGDYELSRQHGTVG